MAFNMKALKEKEADTTINEGKKKEITVGAGLLNDQANVFGSKRNEDSVYLNIDDIEINKNNGYSIEEEQLVELMTSISIFGLQERLCVVETGDMEKPYRLTAGERRFTAIKRLREAGKWGDTVECKVNRLSKIDLPLTDEMKEDFLIMETNSKVRKYTDQDLLQEVKRYDKLYTALRNAGYRFVEKANGVRLQIEGKKNRELLAEQLKTSETRIGRTKRILDKGAPEVVQAVSEGNLSINLGDEVVSSLDQEEQRELVENAAGEKITTATVREFKEKKAENQRIELFKEKIQSDLQALLSSIEEIDKLILTAEQEKKYNKALEEIRKIIKGGNEAC